MSDLKDFVIENGVLTKYVGAGGDVVIPDGVTSIGFAAFRGSKNIINITIPDCVVNIGENAFRECKNIISINIPNGVTKIAAGVFYGCEALTNLSMPNNIKEIGKWAISHCQNLENIILPNSLTKICEYAFSSCTALKAIFVPSSVTNIDNGAFCFCDSLTAIDVAKDNKSFVSQEGVLFNKSKTKLICFPSGKKGTYTVPDGVTEIGNSAFEKCKNLTYINIPDSVKKIGNSAFDRCENLKSITIPSMVPKLGFKALPQNTSIITYAPIKSFAADFKLQVTLGFIKMLNNREVFSEETLNENLKYITSQRKKLYPLVLENLELLIYMIENKIITLDEAVELMNNKGIDATSRTALSEYVESNFNQKQKEDCTKKVQGSPKMTSTELKKIWTTSKNEDGTLTITKYKGSNSNVFIPDMIGKSKVVKVGEEAFSRCKDLITVTIPDSVTEIGKNAFEYCKNLSSISISDSVTKIGKNAFLCCYSLINIDVSIDNKKFSSVDGALYSKDKTQLIVCPNGKAENYIVPDGVTKIHPFAFSECNYLKNIEIPDSVNTIGAGAFECCNALVGVVLPRNITVIEKGTFFDCENLTKVIIPDGVTEIKKYNFVDCGSLKNIGIPSSVIKIGEPSFAGCYDLTLHALVDSYAKNYAEKNNIPFVAE